VAVGINNREYREYLHSYKTESDLLTVTRHFFDFAALRSLSTTTSNVVAKPKRVDLHSVQEEQIKRERQENADSQARMEFTWRRQMGL
jgi:hypothetical protein